MAIPKDEYRRLYEKKRHVYDILAKKVAILIEEISKENGINLHAVTYRAKDVDSFCNKIENPKYNDPFNQITDLAGIRVIAYVEDDVNRICKTVEQYFSVDKDNSIDKSQELGIDRVGYKSVHYVCHLNNYRLELPEYTPFKGLKFEIQIRTILQHSWAEIEHDKDYKFSGVLPPELKRRFKLIAGTLEILDREFNQLSIEIDSYANTVKEKTESGDLLIPIDSESLKQYLSNKFKSLIDAGLLVPDYARSTDQQSLINELQHFGISNLAELASIIPENYENNYLLKMVEPTNFIGFLRLLMIVNNYKKYFDKCYDGMWIGFDEYEINLLRAYNLNTDEIESIAG